jgi:hypothetical protein
MKKVLKLIAILLGIGIVAGCMNTPSKEKMNEELQKPEVAAVIEENLKNLDNNAFTENGKIKSYEIDYNQTYYNPMGGIGFYIIINGDDDLSIKTTLMYDNDKYRLATVALSRDLSKLIRTENSFKN